MSKHKNKFNTTKYIKLSLIYFVLFVAVFGLIDYYALMSFNFIYFIIISFVLAIIIAYYHIKYKKHDHIDDIADEI
jgi:uncharacterized membrane-anchored protein YitT (DUF2179 family)